MEVEVVQQVRAILGESPVWDAARGVLYWADLAGKRAWRLDPASGDAVSAALPAAPGGLALAARGGLVAAFEDGFWMLDPDTGARTLIADPEAGKPDNRFNDGKSGPDGAFWAGSINRAYRPATGVLWRLTPDGAAEARLDGIYVANGLAWSPDGGLFYFGDSVRGVIWAFPFDPSAGVLGERRVLLDRDAAPGFPDGAAMDADGCLWSTRWEGGCLVRITPAGRIDRTVRMPVSRVTSCAFGGPRLETLFVTSAAIGGGEDAAAPLAGSVFAFDPGVQGAPVTPFG